MHNVFQMALIYKYFNQLIFYFSQLSKDRSSGIKLIFENTLSSISQQKFHKWVVHHNLGNKEILLIKTLRV